MSPTATNAIKKNNQLISNEAKKWNRRTEKNRIALKQRLVMTSTVNDKPNDFMLVCCWSNVSTTLAVFLFSSLSSSSYLFIFVYVQCNTHLFPTVPHHTLYHPMIWRITLLERKENDGQKKKKNIRFRWTRTTAPRHLSYPFRHNILIFALSISFFVFFFFFFSRFFTRRSPIQAPWLLHCCVSRSSFSTL